MSDPKAFAAAMDAIATAIGHAILVVRPEDEQRFAELIAGRTDLPPITLKTSPLIEPGKAAVFGRDLLGLEGLPL